MGDHSSNNSSDLILESSLQTFFFDQLTEVNKKSAYPIPQEAIYYSSLVMDQFGESGNYFEVNEEGKTCEKTLGIKLLQSTHMSKQKKKRALKDVGDTALFLCGYFSDSLNKKIVDPEYYQNLGQIAYGRLNNIVPSAYDTPALFKTIAETFDRMASLMNIVSKNNRAKADNADDSYLLYVAANHKIKAS